MSTHLPRWSPGGRSLALRLLPLLSVAFAACRPDLGALPGADPAQDGPLAPSDLTVTIDPPALATAAPRALRLRIAVPEHSVDPDRIALAHGAAGPAQLRQVQRREISATLAKRLIPVQIWWEGEGGALLSEEPTDGATPAALVVAPETALGPGESYALILAEPATIFDLQIAKDDPAPMLPRIWPPLDGSATDRFGLWCGEEALPAVEESMPLAPAGTLGRVRRGLPGSPGLGRSCLCFEAPPGDASGDIGLPPPEISSPSGAIHLDPRPFAASAEHRALEPTECLDGEQAFGPGCARVRDDRIEVRAPAAPALWAIGGEGMDRVIPTAPGEPFVLTGLSPSSMIALEIAAVDNAGLTQRLLFAAQTSAPSPHLVLNEVLANPLGAEPQQEWVELYNDGSLPIDLGGYLLADVGGETPLPPSQIAPGAFALLVNDTFEEDDGYDPPPAAGTLILRVPKLGHAGLTNAGEPLQLRDPGGAVVSRFPPGPKPKAGMSLSRRAPSTPDLAPAGFAPAAPSPGAQNGA